MLATFIRENEIQRVRPRTRINPRRVLCVSSTLFESVYHRITSIMCAKLSSFDYRRSYHSPKGKGDETSRSTTVLNAFLLLFHETLTSTFILVTFHTLSSWHAVPHTFPSDTRGFRGTPRDYVLACYQRFIRFTFQQASFVVYIVF